MPLKVRTSDAFVKVLNENAINCRTKMQFLCLVFLLQVYYTSSSIRSSLIVNKLAKVRPVGDHSPTRFVPLTELPPPNVPHINSARRHLQNDCTQRPRGQEVFGGPRVDIVGDYYDDKYAKTLATVIFPDHIDHKHFQVTTQEPYLTVGLIEGIGYHPSTKKSEYPSECEKIYQDHLEELYSEESNDFSEESLEMARMPLFVGGIKDIENLSTENLYDDYRK